LNKLLISVPTGSDFCLVAGWLLGAANKSGWRCKSKWQKKKPKI